MRGSTALRTPIGFSAAGKQALLSSFSSSHFSTSSGGPPGRARGRGVGGGGPTPFQANPEHVSAESGRPSSLVPRPSLVRPNQPSDSTPKRPILFPEGIIGMSGGTGRGQPFTPPVQEMEENRHLRPRGGGGGGIGAPRGGRGGGRWNSGVQAEQGDGGAGERPRWSRDGAARRATGSRDSGQERGEGGGRGRGRGRGGRGRWREGVAAGGREREWRSDEMVLDEEDQDDESEDDFEWLDSSDDEEEAAKFEKKVGPEVMKKLNEAFDEMESRIFPDEMEEHYLDALDMNLKIELEPEYLVEFENNPDIDERPPMSLEDALEKLKPFLMYYEGIQNQEEWEAAVRETMKQVPLLKQIVDLYSGPDTVTAKEQQKELEKVAKDLPTSAPNSVKRFTDRALLSLQSNPGWGFHKKRQFVDKLVREVSQSYTR